MEIGHWDQLDDISLDWLIGAWLRDMTLGRTNPDTSPAMVFLLLQGDHVNNHLLIRVPSLTMDTQTPCQVKAIPCKSEGIEPFTTVNTLLCQIRAIPHKPEGIEPFTMVNTMPCQFRAIPHKPEGSMSPSPQSTLCCVKSGPFLTNQKV